ncbi:hypothetical protein WOLCODRAFT_133656 [Wolfiporia cocos MD-104 SS10]|uniref:Bromo domain-containing protein n=1 Tax=Wolfiporia cocos (strain MD-104) TaxID=742152 RepID=A0A2H3JB63_WOLCO|nr:hypothetical protein WOLCODRAFT_133656 [Wolfiporia cocos MD-104 SS10]
MFDGDSLSDHVEHGGSGSGSGLKLVIPSLKTVQALKGKKRRNSFKLAQEEPVRKAPRPVKLKPLKEVLAKLIAQIKKKDDYAFFLQPVDVSQVPGYLDVVKRPMDFGTMTTKVGRGRYRSLEEFADDLRLVTTNAKTFNPPGTIYHTEAERIEVWALEHIAKAAATVIEYEADWNIEIERDSADDAGTPMDVDDGASLADSSQTPITPHAQAGSRRRGGGTVKKPPGALSESLEPDGGLPGAKDGLGAFPPGSDWANLMLSLKLRGKRHRTKRERIRMEKGGPPYCPDGSLDYTELENPFSVLSFFVPEPPTRPALTPLYFEEPPFDSPKSPESSKMPRRFPAPVNIPVSSPATFSATPVAPSASSATMQAAGSSSHTKPRRRHWHIQRGAPPRRARDRDGADDEGWTPEPRPAVHTDFGAFATLVPELAEETGVPADGIEQRLGTQEALCEAVRESVEGWVFKKRESEQESEGQVGKAEEQDRVGEEEDVGEGKEENMEENFWKGKGDEAREYLLDVVYGGVDGLAYVCSLAQFVHLDEPLSEDTDPASPPTYSALGMPLATWVARHVLDPLTDGRHRTLTEATAYLSDIARLSSLSPSVAQQLSLSLRAYPRVAAALADVLRTTRAEKVDMAALIRHPEELYEVEGRWLGKTLAEERAQERAQKAEDEWARKKEESVRKAEEARMRGETEGGNEDLGRAALELLKYATEKHQEAMAARLDALKEDSQLLQSVMERTAEMVVELSRQRMEGTGLKAEGGLSSLLQELDDAGRGKGKGKQRDDQASTPAPADAAYGSEFKQKDTHTDEEDPQLKILRLNLLALAKRTPLDQINKLPAELVPASLRGIVPTIDQQI